MCVSVLVRPEGKADMDTWGNTNTHKDLTAVYKDN